MREMAPTYTDFFVDNGEFDVKLRISNFIKKKGGGTCRDQNKIRENRGKSMKQETWRQIGHGNLLKYMSFNWVVVYGRQIVHGDGGGELLVKIPLGSWEAHILWLKLGCDSNSFRNQH